MAKKNKAVYDKPRNWVVPLMRENTKPGPMRDRKKEANKRRCRGKHDEIGRFAEV
jgi:hypothetical protein